MAMFEIINAADSLIHNIFRIVCLFELRVPIYQNQTSFPRAYETNPVTPNFYFISEKSKSLSVRSRSLKTSIE